MSPSDPSHAHGGAPVPSDEEAAAIAAAMEVLWPRPVVIVPASPAEPPLKWRFSGRWWSRPVPVRRERPW